MPATDRSDADVEGNREATVADRIADQPNPEKTLEDLLPSSPRSMSREQWGVRKPLPALLAIGGLVSFLSYYFLDHGFHAGSWSFYIAIGGCFLVVALLVRTRSPWGDPHSEGGSGAVHPDPDVQAMIDGEIDATEYRRRNEARRGRRDKGESAA